MVDYVYICRDGDNEELRYSIRSVVTNMPPGNIWVVGGKPDWYTGNHIPVKQSMTRNKNAVNNLQAVCNSKEISEKFILMNDDFFAVKPVKTIKYYHGGLLADKVDACQDLYPRSSYTRSLEETHRRLLKLGIQSPLDYELHVPMPMTKANLRVALRGGTLWRSTYGNVFHVLGRKITDVKVYAANPLFRKSYDYSELKYDYISSDDESFPMLLETILLDMFPEPTACEQSQLV